MATQSESPPPSVTCSRYYIVRQPDNIMVPLVPVDHLSFQIPGVPRQLNHRQISEQKWQFVDETTESPSILSIDSASLQLGSEQTPQFRAPDYNVNKKVVGILAGSRYDAKYQPPSSPQSPIFVEKPTRVIQDSPSSPAVEPENTKEGSVPATHDHGQPNRTVHPVQGTKAPGQANEKVYCNHWIQHGECRWGDHCRYKHEMPPVDMLRQITGFHKVPRWYKEKMAIQSHGPTWIERQVMLQRKNDEEEAGEPAISLAHDFDQMSSLKRALDSGTKGAFQRKDFPIDRTAERVQLHSKTASPLENVRFVPDTTAKRSSVARSNTLVDPSLTAPFGNTSHAISPSLPSVILHRDATTSAIRPQSDPTPTPVHKSQVFLRRLSQFSWPSDTHSTVSMNVSVSEDAAKPFEQPSKRKVYPKKDKKKQLAPLAQRKQSSMTLSKYAPVEQEVSHVAREGDREEKRKSAKAMTSPKVMPPKQSHTKPVRLQHFRHGDLAGWVNARNRAVRAGP